MSRKKPNGRVPVLRFDVIYVDGSRASNRKVAANELPSGDLDEAALSYFAEQDRQIAERSGIARAAIKSVVRSRA